MKKRKPQSRCKCGHAKSRHNFPYYRFNLATAKACEYCYGDCIEFKLDTLATLERLYEFQEEKSKLSL